MKLLDRTALAITILAALNWLLVGFFDFNLLTAVFGEDTGLNIANIIIGISALWSFKYFNYVPGGYRRNRN